MRFKEEVDEFIIETKTYQEEEIPAIRTVNFRSEAKPHLILNGKLEGSSANFVVDTGAEVTVVSEQQLSKLCCPVHQGEAVNLVGAIPGVKTEAYLYKQMSIQLGKEKFQWDVYVAPVEEDVILGLDFLMYHKANVDLANNEVCINGIPYGAKLRSEEGGSYKVSRISVHKRTVVPPQSAAHIKCKLEFPIDSEFAFQPNRKPNSVLLPHMVHDQSAESCTIVAINDTNKYITLKKDSYVGSAIEIQEIIDEKEQEDMEDDSSEGLDASDNYREEPSSLSSADRTAKILKTEIEPKRVSNSELPSHLAKLYETSTTELSPDEQMKLKQLLIEYQDIFSKDDSDLGHFKEMKFKIDTGDSQPVKHKMRRTPLGFEKEEEGHLNKMLENGIIRKSESSWASSPVLVRKKDGTVRYCLDYRDLNAKTVKDRWPLPSISECLDTLQGNAWFSTLDLAAGYWQFLIEEEDIPKTAFLTKFGLFEHVRMAFGLSNAPSFCQRAMELVLRGMTWKEVIAYLDDVLILGTDFDNHLQRLKKVFSRFRQYNLKLKPKKCHLFQVKVPFLGRIVSKAGVEVDPEKASAVKKYPIPKNTKDVERFLGFVNYHRDFIQNYADRSCLLYQLTGANPFEWTEEHTEAFNDLVNALSSTPVLAFPLSDEPFILDTDASDTAVGAVLSQVQDGQERVICYGSAVLAAAQRNYCTTRKELLAIIRFTRQFRHYLLGRSFTIRTDNGSLTWLMRFKNPSGQVARWLEELSQYEINIIHRKGKLHVNADTLSRVPDELEFCPNYDGTDVKDLPCGGCKFCTRAHNNWARFDDEIDDVIPLANRKIRLTRLAGNDST